MWFGIKLLKRADIEQKTSFIKALHHTSLCNAILKRIFIYSANKSILFSYELTIHPHVTIVNL